MNKKVRIKILTHCETQFTFLIQNAPTMQKRPMAVATKSSREACNDKIIDSILLITRNHGLIYAMTMARVKTNKHMQIITEKYIFRS